MFKKFGQFWVAFFGSVIKKAYNKFFPPKDKGEGQPWRDTSQVNFVAIFVNKLNNLANTEATYEVESDSTQADKLKELCKHIEANRFEVTDNMLADGDYYIFPATNNKGELVHSYLAQGQVCILETDGDEIRDAYGIIQTYEDDRSRVYFLVRHHQLDDSGTLTISYQAYNEIGESVELDMWANVNGNTYTFTNANHIGFGRYKSPVSSRGKEPVYGVPLNYGCADIEKKIFDDLQSLRKELKNAESKLIVDEAIAKETTNEDGRREYTLGENVYTFRPRAGQTGQFIDIYSPQIRTTEHFAVLEADYAMYEQQIGTSRGILTKPEVNYQERVAAIKRANSDTLALIDRIRTAIDKGNKMTLEADAVFLNIAPDLWSYSSDWYDPFEDAAEQWERLKDGKANGAVETADLTKWLFPKLTQKEVEEKLERINSAETTATEDAIDRILAGR